ncbi:MAG: type III-A CRISPR-associated RAMP protein Csm3 [Candidatus Marinimicrobia bacterium]|nr:type III-A CRISPR-associated RAMP protein Csm3 [Candidatus Neomarinimicrobiota bacterium]
MQLTKKIFIRGKIKAETGVHIGGTGQGMAIGGADNPVVRDPITNVPYIPGSSLKGKMRSLLEKATGQVTIKRGKAGPCQCGKCQVCKIYGVAAEADSELPGRLIVRDAHMDKDSINKLDKSKNTDMPFSEVKTEVTIDRITSKANPRQIERVPAGVNFNMEFVIDVYENDDEKELIDTVKESLRLLEDDYLGGSGTRGYGKMSINHDGLKITYKDEAIYREGQPAEKWEG